MKVEAHVPLQRSFAVLAWERVAPAFFPAIVTAACLFALLWTGTYALLPAGWHVAALAASVLAMMGSISWGMARFRYPSRQEALRRIEARNSLRAGILDGVFARSFGGQESHPLWQASRQRLAQLVGRPKTPLPQIDWRKVDPLYLRFAAMLIVLLAIVSTRGSQDGLRASLIPQSTGGAPILVDAWLEPPGYTGLPSRILRGTHPRLTHTVPADTKLHVRLRRDDGAPVRGVMTFKASEGQRHRVRPATDGAGAVVLALQESGEFTITAAGTTRPYQFRTIIDQPPQLRVLSDPDTSTGSISFDVEVLDDYPLAEGTMVLSLVPGQKLSADAPMPDDRILEEPWHVDLADLAGPPGQRRIDVETVEHPWAGLLVKASIEVTDGIGQKATSEPFAFTMPQRTFYNPLSKTVVAERQKLAMAPSYLNDSSRFFRALTTAPDLFDIEPAAHLMLKATAQALSAAKQRDVPGLIEGLWPLAIELEDDGLAFAKAQLDEAEKALREALRNGAGQDVLSQRIAELREAMSAYLRALAESGLAQADLQQGQQTLAQTDLEDLLRQLEDLASQGSREQAEALLRQLEAMLQSMQVAQGGSGQPGSEGQPGAGGQGQSGAGGTSGQGQGGEDGAGAGALSGAGDLIQQQRELADQTFSARRGDRPGSGLGGEQEGLAEQLQELREGLTGDDEAAAEAFRRAEEAMRDAARALDNGQLSQAQRAQEQALSALREGGKEIAELLDAEGADGEEGSLSGTDPFGRAWDGGNGPNPEDFGLNDPERIRQLISRIRQRLEDPSLTDSERTYLESLLERF